MVHFFFNDTATTEIYTLSLHDALPISVANVRLHGETREQPIALWHTERPSLRPLPLHPFDIATVSQVRRSEEHTSELQSQSNLVCRLLLEKKKASHFHSVQRH